MRAWTVIGAKVAAVFLVGTIALPALQAPTVLSVEETVLREYTGVYQWKQDSIVYLQMWTEFASKNQLVAFDESGEVRTLYPTDHDRFFAGPGLAVAAAIESRIESSRLKNAKTSALRMARFNWPVR